MRSSAGHAAQRARAHAQQLDRLGQRRVRLRRAVHGERRAGAPVVPTGAPASPSPRTSNPALAFRATASAIRFEAEHPLVSSPPASSGYPSSLLAPVQHLQLDVVVGDERVDAAHRVRRRRQHLGDHAHRRARAQHPAPEPRVAVAELVRPHVLEPLRVDLVHGLRPRRRRPGEVRLDVRRRVLPRGALAQGRHVVHGVVHGAVRERAQLRPVLGVEGLFVIPARASLRASWRSFWARAAGRGDPTARDARRPPGLSAGSEERPAPEDLPGGPEVAEVGHGHGDRGDLAPLSGWSRARRRTSASRATPAVRWGVYLLAGVRGHELLHVRDGGGVGRRLSRQREERRRRAAGRRERGERAHDGFVQRAHGRLRLELHARQHGAGRGAELAAAEARRRGGADPGPPRRRSRARPRPPRTPARGRSRRTYRCSSVTCGRWVSSKAKAAEAARARRPAVAARRSAPRPAPWSPRPARAAR